MARCTTSMRGTRHSACNPGNSCISTRRIACASGDALPGVPRLTTRHRGTHDQGSHLPHRGKDAMSMRFAATAVAVGLLVLSGHAMATTSTVSVDTPAGTLAGTLQAASATQG